MAPPGAPRVLGRPASFEIEASDSESRPQPVSKWTSELDHATSSVGSNPRPTQPLEVAPSWGTLLRSVSAGSDEELQLLRQETPATPAPPAPAPAGTPGVLPRASTKEDRGSPESPEGLGRRTGARGLGRAAGGAQGETGLFLCTDDAEDEDHADLFRPATPLQWFRLRRGSAEVPCDDRLRYMLLSLRLLKIYVAYCCVCFAFSMVICISTVIRATQLKREGGDLSSHRWYSWEAGLETLLGAMVCLETLSTLWISGLQAFCRDLWCIFDATVSALTLLSWCLLVSRRVYADLGGESTRYVDQPVLALRFVLQPCRVLSTFFMVQRVRRMQNETVDINFEVLKCDTWGVEPETPSGSLLTPELRAELVEHLPTWCKFREWHLAYSPSVHGTSMQTFYRSQADAHGGPNVILVREVCGGLLGGFCSEEWRHCAKGYYGNRDCFVFTAAPGGQPEFYHTDASGDEVVLWGDEGTFSLAGAVVVYGNFGYGSSAPCAAFGSPVLSAEGEDFAVGAFECWQLASGSPLGGFEGSPLCAGSPS